MSVAGPSGNQSDMFRLLQEWMTTQELSIGGSTKDVGAKIPNSEADADGTPSPAKMQHPCEFPRNIKILAMSADLHYTKPQPCTQAKFWLPCFSQCCYYNSIFVLVYFSCPDHEDSNISDSQGSMDENPNITGKNV